MLTFALISILVLLTGFAVLHCCGTPMSRAAKAGWAAALVLLPGLGLVAYVTFYALAYRLEYV